MVTTQIIGVNFEDGSTSFEGRVVSYRFTSTIPGLHTVQNQIVDGHGTERDGSWSYQQRRLEFTDEFPEYDESSTDPVEIQNSVLWNGELQISDVEWEVEVASRFSKTGTGSNIFAIWKPVEDILERYVDPATVPVEETLHPTSLQVTAKAPIFTEHWTENGSIYYQITGGTDVPRRSPIKIVEPMITPDEPFTAENYSATVNAVVISFDLELPEGDINWKVDIKNSAGAVVVEDLATGTGFDIEATWDGTLANGDPLPAEDDDPKTYVFALTADPCGEDDGGGIGVGRALNGVNGQIVIGGDCDPDLFAHLDVPIEGFPRIEICSDDGGDLLAIGFLDTDANDVLRATKNELTSIVHRYGPTDSQDQVLIRVYLPDLVDSGSLEVSVHSLVSDKTLAPLNLSEVRSGVFERVVDINSNLLDVRPPSEATDTSVQKRFALGEIYRDNGGETRADVDISPDSTDYRLTWGLLSAIVQNLGFYEPPVMRLGVFSEAALDREELMTRYEDGVLPDDEVPSTPENVISFGFEAIRVSVLDLPEPLEATVKVPNPADLVMWNFHGDRFGTVYLSDDRDRIRQKEGAARLGLTIEPNPIFQTRTPFVDAFVLAACSALCLNDYNNNYIRRPDGDWPPPSDRNFGGKAWDQATGQGERAKVLLGYNNYATATTTVFNSGPRQVLAYYRDAMANLSGVPEEDRQQWAWMAANIRFALDADLTNRRDYRFLGLNACAVDDRYYYYIPYGQQREESDELVQPTGVRLSVPSYSSVSRKTPVYRVPRPGVTDPLAPQRETIADWTTTPQDWAFNRRGIGTPVPIPGVTFPPGSEEVE